MHSLDRAPLERTLEPARLSVRAGSSRSGHGLEQPP